MKRKVNFTCKECGCLFQRSINRPLSTIVCPDCHSTRAERVREPDDLAIAMTLELDQETNQLFRQLSHLTNGIRAALLVKQALKLLLAITEIVHLVSRR